MQTFHTPETILADISLRFFYIPQLWLITGQSGAGKTSACLRLVQQARRLGCPLSGIISPPVYESETKVAIDLTELGSGETRRLARRNPPHPAPGPAEAAGLATRGWSFDPAVVAWGNQALEDAPAGSVLLIDELGPLEFQQGAGFSAGLRRLDEPLQRAAFAVVRSSLLPAAVQRWPAARVITDLANAFRGAQS